MRVLRSVIDVRRVLASHRGGAGVGFAPTMGALHDGHVALFNAARDDGGLVVASIFVNPAQFDDPADLAAYPRTEARDAEIAAAANVDLLFIPPTEEVYPAGSATRIVLAGAALEFEGRARPGHFDGVALVCAKLFNIVQPTVAYLGQKDAQQVAVVRQVVRDLDVPLEIRVVPTVREPDGLALSSRNVRLTPEDRARALAVPRALAAGLQAHRAGHDPVPPARAALAGLDIDYVGVASFDGEPTLVVAVRVGVIRLIDNVPLNQPRLAGL